jgi:transposase
VVKLRKTFENKEGFVEAYSKEFRREVLRACDSRSGTREVALQFGVSESWVRRIKQERRELGKTAPCTTRQRQRIWEPYSNRIVAIIQRQPDLTLKELQQVLGEAISVQSLCRALQHLQLTMKKKC